MPCKNNKHENETRVQAPKHNEQDNQNIFLKNDRKKSLVIKGDKAKSPFYRGPLYLKVLS